MFLKQKSLILVFFIFYICFKTFTSFAETWTNSTKRLTESFESLSFIKNTIQWSKNFMLIKTRIYFTQNARLSQIFCTGVK